MPDDESTSIFDEDKREIYLVTTSDNRRPCGMIVTWVTPASLIPEAKRIVLVLSPHSDTAQALLQQRQFMIHRLAHDQAALVPTFGLYSSREVNKFAAVPFTLDEGSGMPIVHGTCAWARGHLISQMDAGDRLVLLARLEKETADFTKRSLRVGDLAQHIPAATLQAMQEKYVRDVERDRQIRAQTS